MYLLGDFSVRLDGGRKILSSPAPVKSLGSIKNSGMPFYGGNLDYLFEFECKGGDLELTLPSYSGELVAVYLDGERRGRIILPPYSLNLRNVSAGRHELKLRLFGNRHNTFGSLHWAKYDPYCGPMHWRKSGEDFTYGYRLCNMGLTDMPRLKN